MLAIALLGAVPGAASAVDFGGNIRLGLANSGVDDSGQTTGEMDVVSGKLVINAGGTEILDSGFEFSWGVEFENDSADAESDGFSNDKSWVALGGDFGKVIIGEHSDMAGWACGGTDVLIYGEAEACSLGHNTSPANAIQYRGGSDMIDFGFAVTWNNTGESDGLVGARFTAGDLAVGGQVVFAADDFDPDSPDGDFFGGVPAGERGLQLGGTYALGGLYVGLTIADNGADDDSGGVDIGVQLPLAGGNLAIVVSALEADNFDSQDILYSRSLSDNAYAGLEVNFSDALDDDVITAFVGTTF